MPKSVATNLVDFKLTLLGCCSYNNQATRKIGQHKRVLIIGALVEGGSVNATARMCGVSKLTVADLVSFLEDEECKVANGGRINREDRP